MVKHLEKRNAYCRQYYFSWQGIMIPGSTAGRKVGKKKSHEGIETKLPIITSNI